MTSNDMNTGTHADTTTPTTDPRTLAEERLVHLSMLQMRMQRHGGPGRMHDPRGGQGRVLALLARNPQISQRELTFLLGLSRQALAELLAKLEAKGLIERTQSDADRRMVLVSLTDSGREAAQGIQERMQEPSSVLDSLDDDEVAHLADYLGRIIDTLEAQMEKRREERRRHHEDGERFRGGRGPRGPHFGPGYKPHGDREHHFHHGRGRCHD